LRAILAEGRLSEWAAPLFFLVPEGPSAAEVERAIEVLRRLEAASLPAIAVARPAGAQASGIIGLPPAEYEGGGPASLKVAGEVRSVDPGGEPRLWGKGRPGAKLYGRDDDSGTFCTAGPIQYGLSLGITNWSSAADACPEGTWVCRSSEIASAPACDTGRPDLNQDTYLCNGDPTNWGSTSLPGWLADQSESLGSGLIEGYTLSEDGSSTSQPLCSTMPVWCCFD
jgi:hypothetical protein